MTVIRESVIPGLPAETTHKIVSGVRNHTLSSSNSQMYNSSNACYLFHTTELLLLRSIVYK